MSSSCSDLPISEQLQLELAMKEIRRLRIELAEHRPNSSELQNSKNNDTALQLELAMNEIRRLRSENLEMSKRCEELQAENDALRNKEKDKKELEQVKNEVRALQHKFASFKKKMSTLQDKLQEMYKKFPQYTNNPSRRLPPMLTFLLGSWHFARGYGSSKFTKISFAFGETAEHLGWKLDDMDDYEDIDRLTQIIDNDNLHIHLNGMGGKKRLEVTREGESSIWMRYLEDERIKWHSVYDKQNPLG